jgi:hypothetical protein
MVGGSWDGTKHEVVGPSLMMVKRGLARGWVAGYRADSGDELPTPMGLDSTEVYVLTNVMGHYGGWAIYIEAGRRQQAIAYEAAGLAQRERARDYAAEAAREDCSAGVNRVFADWAYAAIIEAQIAEAKASNLYMPDDREPEKSNPPDGGETLH